MAAEPFPSNGDEHGPEPPRPTGLLDLLSVAALVVDADGRLVFWTPQAEELFGYTSEEALGKYAARLFIHPEHLQAVTRLFAEVLETGRSWAGTFPIRHKDGSIRLTEFRNMRLVDDLGSVHALGIAADHNLLQRVETDLALCERLISQSPIGIALMDPALHYLLVNPALERIDGIPAEDHIGRGLRETLPFPDVDTIESALRQVLATGTPLLDQYHVGRPPADPDHEHAWSLSFYRLEDPGGRVLGAATSVVDVTERHRVAAQADQARRRLALIADASTRVGTTLEVEQTAQELADIATPNSPTWSPWTSWTPPWPAAHADTATARSSSAPLHSRRPTPPWHCAPPTRPVTSRPTTVTAWSPCASTPVGRSW